MLRRREYRFSVRRLAWHKIKFWFTAGASIALLSAFSAAVTAQQPASAIVAPGDAAVTGFAGSLPPIQIPPGVDPGEKTFIDLNGPSLRVIDLKHMSGPPNAQLVGAPKPFTSTAAHIGQVFGVALDDASPPNIYAAATSAYGLPIIAPGPDGQPHHIKTGVPNAAFMPGLWGPQGGPGSIWKIDGVSGKVTLFANVMLGGRSNSGAALGALTFEPESKSLFVSDRESGLIYRLALDGRVLDHYDHGVAGRQAQGLPPVPWNSQAPIDITGPPFDSTLPATWNYAAPERRVFGLAVFGHRLYYAVADSLQIWSVGLNHDGSFGSDAVIELAVPPSSGPTEISTIAFDEQGRMFLADRPAPTGAFDFEALAVPAIGRVLRYAQSATASDGRRIWQEAPDQYAIGFPRDFRNGNGGVAIGHSYDHKGDIVFSSCGGFMWSTGEDLREASDAALAARLAQSGPLHIDGLQGNGTWRIERNQEPPLASYFIAYIDELEDAAARGHMGDITIALSCTPRIQYPSSPPQPPPGTPPIRHGGLPPGTQPGAPPGTPPQIPGSPPGPPPGGCSPNQLRNANTGGCVPNCPRPNIQVNRKCCSVATLAANAACSNSSCPAGQAPIGPSNFCCSSSEVYTGANGAQACCSQPLVNGQCQPSPPPPPSTCLVGYVPVGSSCCLANQLTSTGKCCPAGQTPSGPNNSQCVPFIPVHLPPPTCCPPGQIPVAGAKSCCPTANVTSNGVCCPSPVDPNDRAQCRRWVPIVPSCARGYTRMPDGSCCNNRYMSADRTSCNIPRRRCAPGEFRDLSGACVPMPSPTCPPGEIRTRDGRCVPAVPPPCPPGEIRRGGECAREQPTCPRGEVRREGRCVRGAPTTCPPGETLRRGACVPSRPAACPPGQVRDRGRCIAPAPMVCPPGQVRREGSCVAPAGRACPPGMVRTPRGFCVRIGPPSRLPGGGGFGPPGGRIAPPRRLLPSFSPQERP